MARQSRITDETKAKALKAIQESPLKRTVYGGAGHWYCGNPAGEGPSVRVGSSEVVSALYADGKLIKHSGDAAYYLK